MTKRLNTVNVIYITDKDDLAVQELAAFPDNARGNQLAEKLFADKVRSLAPEAMSDEDVDSYVEDGSYHQGPAAVILVHST